MKVVIAGPRDLYVPLRLVQAAIDRSPFYIIELVNGMADGIDLCARRWQEEMASTLPVAPFLAPWETWKELGLKSRASAGPYRNSRMAAYADGLIIIRRKVERTRGTNDMIRQMEVKRKPIYILNVDPEYEVAKGDLHLDTQTKARKRELEDKAYACLFEAAQLLRRAGEEGASLLIGRAVEDLDEVLGRKQPTRRMSVKHLENTT